MSTNIEVLRSRLAAVDARLAAIERIEPTLPHQSEVSQAMGVERGTLQRLRRETMLEIEKAEAAPRVDERRNRIIAARSKEIAEHATWFAAKLDAEGDHRQAVIWRLHAVRAAEQAEQELSDA